jgi:fumarylacetoacetase
MRALDATHDPALASWVESAQAPGADFPIQNLPYGRFRRSGRQEAWRCGVAIGDQVLDLQVAMERFPWTARQQQLLQPLADGDLNGFMAHGFSARHEIRAALSSALARESSLGAFLELCLVPQADVEMAVPCRIGDYTDFFAGIHHARRVGAIFRPDDPLLPNYKWVPIGYHGRASSIVPSGTPVVRPNGQRKGPDGQPPLFGPSTRLDYELELGAVVGTGNRMGEPVSIADAGEHLFGMVLLNDWSARDVQAWEYQPLGPFLAKSFATTLSPWVVTMEALMPYRIPLRRPEGDPAPLPHLAHPDDLAHGAHDIHLEVQLQTRAMRERGTAPATVSRSNFGHAYWTLAQLLAHHTSNGCNLQPGDLLGTGTLSGPEDAEGGSLLELSAGNTRDVALPGGETRRFLEDGDRVVLRAYAERPGAPRIGFGTCEGTVVAGGAAP